MATIGVKESLEVLEAVRVALVDVKAITADGKVNFSDLPVLMQILGQLGTFNAGLQGANLIPAELKDLDPQESQQLLAKVSEIVAIFKA